MRGGGVIDLSGLTRRAGLSTGALYHHFGSKAGLLVVIYDDFYDGLVHAIADTHLDLETEWRVHEFERTRRFVDYHMTDPLAPILLNRSALDPQLAELEATYLQRISHNAGKNIRRGQKLGQLPSISTRIAPAPSSSAAFATGLLSSCGWGHSPIRALSPHGCGA